MSILATGVLHSNSLFKNILKHLVRSAYSPEDTPARGKWITAKCGNVDLSGENQEKMGPEKRSIQVTSTYSLIGNIMNWYIANQYLL